ncbi:hypothetical protein MKO06_02700 [Gramella sp. GC03-9]|uniref:Uncharacterized protein n=1 Tax=Christiangramia oceanisediminis TaxID=2920386 RepID=A0A9X2IA22_9FLAO|nr:hypothetical protein [Gramella oceanisediminis]MCP9198798.1 hypothetical protein [Gramella oceanisediminis]
MNDNRNQYILEFPDSPEPWYLDQDPMNSNDTEIEIGRAKLTFGMFGTIANNLKFPGPIMDKLEAVYQSYGPEAKIKLTKLSKHTITDDWQLIYTGYLDLLDRRIENNIFSCSYVEGGFREVLSNQQKEKFEIDRKTDIYNRPISQLHPDILDLKQGRRLFLLSKLSTTDNFTAHSGIWRPNDYEFRESFRPFPVTVITNNDPLNIQIAHETLGFDQRWEKSTQNMFFATADRDRGRIKMTASIDFKLTEFVPYRTRNEYIKIVLDRYDENLNRIERDELGTYNNLFDLVGQSIQIENFEKIFSVENGTEIKEGESLAFGIYMAGDFRGGLNISNDSYYTLAFSDVDVKIDWAEDSYFRPTTTKVVTAKNTGERLSEILTGKPAFKSKTLSEDKWKDLLFTVGFWLRNMDEVSSEDRENEERTLTLSWEDFHNSINALQPMAYGIVTQGAKQFLVYERREYFFQPYVTVELNQPSNIKRFTAREFIFSHVQTGYQKGGNYERPLGLDEPNIKTNYVLPLSVSENKYDVTSPSRSDGYAIEDCRRKQAVDFPEEDTSYDKDVFMIHGKKTGEVRGRYDLYDLRHWQDNFEQAPTGIYDPDSAFNLTMSPANNRNEHAIWFNSATVKYPDRYMVYANTEGNVQLTTKYPDKDPVYERGDVQIKDLKKPIHAYDWIEFDYPFSQELLNKIQGNTMIDGEEVPKWYGQFQFVNERGKRERGYLFSVKIKQNNMKFKLLKSA